MAPYSSVDDRRKAVRNLKSRLVDLSLVVMAVIAIPGLISSLSRISEMGFIAPMYFHIVIAAFLLILGFYRKKFSYNFRANSILVVLFLIGFAGMWNLGLSGNGSLFLLVCVIISSVLFSKKAGIKMFVLSSIFILGKTLILYTTDSTFSISFELYNYAISSWVAMYFGFCFVSILMLSVLGQFNKFFYNMVEELEDLISQRTQELEQANQAKSQFLSNISHEIRTPLNGIIGIHRLLACSSLNETQHRQLNIADKSARSLLHVVNDVLDFSAVENGNLQLYPMKFELVELLKDLIEKMQAQLKNDQVVLELICDVKQPTYIYADRHRLSQILINLISNAIKFTNRGEIVVSAKTTAIKQPNGVDGWLFDCSVMDTGIGIADSIKDKLFDSFYQIDASSTRKFGGSGLGLTLVKSLCEVMQGKVEVSSVLGQGSEFRFEVILEKYLQKSVNEPVVKTNHEIVKADFDNDIESQLELVHVPTKQSQVESFTDNNKQNFSVELSQAEILIVEDNPINQEVLLGILEELGACPDIAINGLDAIKKLEQKSDANRRYHAILMDCQMPEMDGYEATQQIRNGVAGQSHQSTIIIAVTANAMEGDKEKCLNAGMNDYLAKPINPQYLLKKLNFWLNNDKSTESKSEVTQGTKFQPELNQELKQNPGKDKKVSALVPNQSQSKINDGQSLPVWDRQDVLKRVMQKVNLLHSLLGSFIAEMPQRMKDLSEAINHQDSEQVAKHAHAIKGISANLGAMRLHKTSVELEALAKKNALAKIVVVQDEITQEYEALSKLFKAELEIKASLSGRNDKEFFSKIKHGLMQLEAKLVSHDYIDPDEINKLINLSKNQLINQKLQQMKQQITQFDTESAQESIDEIVKQLDIEVK
jgi:signal transduction histidine kinase/CheY-like chemotaxis protein/HPt (histidine-containing phosphotransfer) domain-containing protein